MDVRGENGKPRYWREVVDKRTGVCKVTVAAEITFALDGSRGMLVEYPRLVVAGGMVATAGLITVDEVLAMVTETHELLDDKDVDVTTQHTSDANLPDVSPPLLLVPAEGSTHERSPQEESAAIYPVRFT